MRVELLKTLKGQKLWKKGTVFDDADTPFPRDIQGEIQARSRVIKVLPDLPKRVVEVAAEIVAAKPEPEPQAEQDEIPQDIFPELERLIELQGTIASVARLMDVSTVTINRWRQKRPRAEVIQNVKEAYAKVTAHDQNRADNPSPAGVEGAYFQPE